MTRPRNVRIHKCECTKHPMCLEHGAAEWGGGEPDKCQTHAHLPTGTRASIRSMFRWNR